MRSLELGLELEPPSRRLENRLGRLLRGVEVPLVLPLPPVAALSDAEAEPAAEVKVLAHEAVAALKLEGTEDVPPAPPLLLPAELFKPGKGTLTTSIPHNEHAAGAR